MTNQKRSNPGTSRGRVAHITVRIRYSYVILLTTGVALLAFAYLLEPPTAHRAINTEASNVRSATVPPPHGKPAMRPSLIASAGRDQRSHNNVDLVLKDPHRPTHASLSTQDKVDALARFAKIVATRDSEHDADLLDHAATAAFDEDFILARMVALESVVPELKLAAIAHLAQGTDAQAPEILARVATDPDPDIRRGAIDGLGLLLQNDPQIRYTLGYLSQTEMEPANKMLIEDWLMAADSTEKQ